MSKGKCDYTRYMIKPQRGMRWARAVQFMLQSEKNEIIGLPIRVHGWETSPTVYHFRISESRVLQYKPRADSSWSNAAGHDFSHISRFDAASLDDCSDGASEIEERLDWLQAQIEELSRKKKGK